MAKKIYILHLRVRSWNKDILPSDRSVNVCGLGGGFHWEAKCGMNLLV